MYRAKTKTSSCSDEIELEELRAEQSLSIFSRLRGRSGCDAAPWLLGFLFLLDHCFLLLSGNFLRIFYKKICETLFIGIDFYNSYHVICHKNPVRSPYYTFQWLSYSHK